MDRKEVITLVASLTVFALMIGGIYAIDRVKDPFVRRTVEFEGAKHKIVVFTKRPAIGFMPGVGYHEITRENGTIIARDTVGVPRKPLIVTTRTATREEKELFTRFF